jgi:hypothetical protein
VKATVDYLPIHTLNITLDVEVRKRHLAGKSEWVEERLQFEIAPDVSRRV